MRTNQFHAGVSLVEPSPVGPGSGLRRLTDRDLPYLQALLDRSKTDDPYQLSAGYFAMTGRLGLWIARDRDSTVIVCRHPNAPDTMLVFPPIADAGVDLLDATIARLLSGNAKLTLARTEPELANALGKRLRSCILRPVRETVLDWAFPVHVIDTGRVVAGTGRSFQNFRTELRKIDAAAVEVLDLCPRDHRAALLDLVCQWAAGDQSLVAPYERLIELFAIAPLRGRVVFMAGRPVGLSVWEAVPGRSRPANVFALLGLRDIAGMSRFVVLDMCRRMRTADIAHVCIGGSETRGLDRFKRQLRPVRSIAMNSWRIEPR